MRVGYSKFGVQRVLENILDNWFWWGYCHHGQPFATLDDNSTWFGIAEDYNDPPIYDDDSSLMLQEDMVDDYMSFNLWWWHFSYIVEVAKGSFTR